MADLQTLTVDGSLTVTGNIVDSTTMLVPGGLENTPSITRLDSGNSTGMWVDTVFGGLNFVVPISGVNREHLSIFANSWFMFSKFGETYTDESHSQTLISFGSNSGYHFDGSNGLAMQWGTITLGPGADGLVTFPVSFNETPLIFTGLRAPSAGAYHAFGKAYSITSSNCRIKNENVGTPATGNAIVNWFAYGGLYG